MCAPASRPESASRSCSGSSSHPSVAGCCNSGDVAHGHRYGPDRHRGAGGPDRHGGWSGSSGARCRHESHESRVPSPRPAPLQKHAMQNVEAPISCPLLRAREDTSDTGSSVGPDEEGEREHEHCAQGCDRGRHRDAERRSPGDLGPGPGRQWLGPAFWPQRRPLTSSVEPGTQLTPHLFGPSATPPARLDHHRRRAAASGRCPSSRLDLSQPSAAPPSTPSSSSSSSRPVIPRRPIL